MSQIRVEDFGAADSVQMLVVTILRWITRLNKQQFALLLACHELHVVARIFRLLYMWIRLGFPWKSLKSSKARVTLGAGSDLPQNEILRTAYCCRLSH